MTVSQSAIAGMFVAGIICTLAPIAMIIIFKLKNRDIPLTDMFYGVLINLVAGIIALIPMYAVSVLFDTADIAVRFALDIVMMATVYFTLRLIMKKTVASGDPRHAVMLALGYGGAGMVGAALNLLLSAFICVLYNAGSLSESIGTKLISGALNSDFWTYAVKIPASFAQLVMLVSAIVLIYAAANDSARLWYFPAAAVAAFLFDLPSLLYGKIALPKWTLYAAMFTVTVAIAFVAVRVYKSMRKPVTV